MESILNTRFNQVPEAGTVCEVSPSPAQLLHMCILQDEANTVMSSEAWRDSTDDTLWYYRAINNELGECSSHIGIKWWKNEHPNEEIATSAFKQARMEVIDVLHFALSNLVRGCHQSNTELEVGVSRHLFYPKLFSIGRFSQFSQRDVDLEPSYSELTINDFIEQCQYVNLVNGHLPLNYVMVLAELLDLSANDLYVAYVGKNVLNKFRTTNGQREGTYLKIWNGIEDNEYLTEYLTEALASSDLPNIEALILKLNTQYQTFLTQGLCTRG